MDEVKNAFKKNLREELKIRQITIREMADDIGISRSAAYKYTSRQSLPSAENLKKICRYFGVSMEYMLTSR
ncbi:MAG: helix-turn-helix domain-containing protein [Lachnospiraceae bacterium]